jgi:MFS family permease
VDHYLLAGIPAGNSSFLPLFAPKLFPYSPAFPFSIPFLLGPRPAQFGAGGSSGGFCPLPACPLLERLGIGLTGPLISYWFALRFQVGPFEIAPVMAATFVITGFASLLTGWLTGRIGIVQSVVWERMVGTGLMALLPVMPTYWLASLVFLLRAVFSRASAGAQQALTIGLVREERRGLAASLNAVSFQLPRSVGPGIAGYLLEAGQFSLPFYTAAVLQGIYLIWYKRIFRFYEPPRTGAGGSGRAAEPPQQGAGNHMGDWH